MHTHDLSRWQHGHVFGQDQVQPGERRTLLVVIITAFMMVGEVGAGWVYGSMALLADGLHMASHTLAMGLSVLAYVYARRQAANSRFSFGTGKVNSLAGFASAILLGGFALAMAVESSERFFNPVEISFDQAIIVSCLGLIVNGASAWLLAGTPHNHGDGTHDHNHHHHDHHHDHHHGHDQNLRAAYLHVLADLLTSLLAVAALLCGKFYGAYWLDPAMGIVGAIVVGRWTYSLLIESSSVLLDQQADNHVAEPLRNALEGGTQDRVADLHVWKIGHGILAVEIAIVSDEPKSPDHYKSLIPDNLNIVHAIVEVHRCRHE